MESFPFEASDRESILARAIRHDRVHSGYLLTGAAGPTAAVGLAFVPMYFLGINPLSLLGGAGMGGAGGDPFSTTTGIDPDSGFPGAPDGIGASNGNPSGAPVETTPEGRAALADRPAGKSANIGAKTKE